MKLSEPRYGWKINHHVLIPMRDGVKLSAHVILPDAPGKFSAIFEYTPYRKGYYTEPWACHRYFVERGYAYVHVDIRGTGDSEGITDDVYSDDERRDGYEVVEWIAQQSWCDGNVGMMGISYCAIVCWFTAVQRPPHLKAIIVRCGHDDPHFQRSWNISVPRQFC